MKRILLVAACMVATVGALAQGTLKFANVGGGLNAPIKDSTGANAAVGSYMVQLYVGTSAESLSPTTITAPFKAAGYFSLTDTVLVPGIPEGGTAFLKVAAFSNANGTTSYDAALAANLETGMSGVFSVSLGGNSLNPPVTPPYMVGLQGFQMTVVPEPSTIALGALAAGALLLFRRK